MFCYHEGKSYPCHLCNIKFTRKETLKNHVSKIHENLKPVKNYRCSQCDHVWSSPYLLKNHFDAVHSGTKNFKCEICAKSFAILSYLTKHKSTIHSKTRTECDLCGIPVVEEYLEQHKYLKHTARQKIECHICHKQFQSKDSLRNHIKNHHTDGGRVYKCEICQRAFNYLRDLTSHKSRKHEILMKLFQCDFCDKSFCFESYLKKHVMKMHKI